MGGVRVSWRTGTKRGGGLKLFPQDTYSVSQLGAEIRAFLKEAFFAVWVAGEVERPRVSQRGHLYLELVEKGERDEIIGKLDAVVWRRDYQRVRHLLSETNQEIREGQLIRCRGEVDFYSPSGRLQFIVRQVDPVFTLGLLAQRRRQTLEALAAAGLLERNRQLPLPPLPLTVGLVTSRESAAYHDFLSTLRESGYAFRVLFTHVAVQGREAETEIAAALASLTRVGVDCVVLVRGGGSRTDLAAFDSRAIAESVARAPFPVLTGLGHEVDESIADLVAHTAFKTPTKVGEFLVERMAQAERALSAHEVALCRLAMKPLERARHGLARAERGLDFARLRLAGAAIRLRGLARSFDTLGKQRIRQAENRKDDSLRRLVRATPRLLERRRSEPRLLAQRLVALSRARLREVDATLSTLRRLCFQIAPERTLERGFSITRRGDGQLVRRADRVAAGEEIQTQLAQGSLRSRVESP